MLPEVRMARVLGAVASHRAGRLSCVEAGELLGMSQRHFRRLRDAYENRGEEGLIDRRRGRVSASRVADEEAAWLAEMVTAQVRRMRPRLCVIFFWTAESVSDSRMGWFSNHRTSLRGKC